MIPDIKQLDLVQLRALLSHKKQIYDNATDSGKSHAELSELYKEYKTIQQELNLRKITNMKAKP